jgi:hypothetical protein
MNLRKLNLLDVAYVCRHMRAADAHEIFATRRTDDPDALAVEIIRYWGPMGFVAVDGELPVALFGATETWPGVWTAWMMATDEFPSVALGLTKFVKRRMIPELIGMGAFRGEARSVDGHTEAHRWLRVLGGVEEARLRRYGRNGEDFLVFRFDRPEHVHQ